MRQATLILFLLSFAGCSTYSYENSQSMGHQVFRPNISTSFYGQLHAEPLADYLSVMQAECSKVDRKLDSTNIQTVYTNFIGEKIYRYTCIERLPNRSVPANQNYLKPNSEVIAADPAEPQATPPTQKLDAQPTNKFMPLDLTSAKAKCIDLGFKPKTEKFGNCVLELTK